MPLMKTLDLNTKIITKKPKNPRNCESRANGVLQRTGKLIRHITIRKENELDRPFVRRYLQAAIEQIGGPAQVLRPTLTL
jgi:hypothetical protein